MNYFILKYTNDMPDKFGGETRGPLISIRPKYSADVGLIEHEKTHVRQWYVVLALGLLLCTLLTLLVSPSLWPMYGLAPFLHQLLYKFIRPYRARCEVQAYRRQIEVGGYISNDFSVTMLVAKYDLGLCEKEVRTLHFS